ncbi:hypothetical protein [Clostridium tagluense]|uniref:hypothetical protein n=1 Tax=Clostridium tagluense TaxID=360422 RepID=UPI001C6E120E|nr:hypothetical protein [Clostridium tagluense]MBW9159472.1 hypothetical protein [Clostridium tagluense]WLC68480.1 hypothetical protein KTC93_25540 [Clostridium tagluense]
MKNLIKIANGALLTCLIVSGTSLSAFASTPSKTAPTTVTQSKMEQSKIEQDAVDKVLKKYNLEVLTEKEVTSLKLNKIGNSITPISADELEKIIIQQQQVQPIVEKNEITIHVGEDTKNLQVKLGATATATAATVVNNVNATKIFANTTSSLSNTNCTVSAAGSYSYTYTKYPVGPPEITNLRFTSCSSGNVSVTTQNSMLPQMYQLEFVTSSSCKIVSSTKLQHNYNYTVGNYVAIGIPNTPLVKWVRTHTNNITGTTNYNLSI